MDENSCEGETSKSIGNVVDEQEAKKAQNGPELENLGVRFASEGKDSSNQVSNRCGSSFDASVSGPSKNFCHFKSENDTTQLDDESKETEDPTKENEQGQPETTESGAENAEPTQTIASAEQNEAPTEPEARVEETAQQAITAPLPNYQYQPRVRLAPCVEEQLEARRPSVGPPPSYSFVMKQKKKLKPVPSLDPLVTDRPPPPTYANTRGLYGTLEENRLERICNLPSFAEPIWRSHSQPALCPRCGIIVLTTTHSHDSVATHVAALALCLFGCWPCCLLPYCMNVCKNTYHHCPICQTFLGLYTPW